MAQVEKEEIIVFRGYRMEAAVDKKIDPARTVSAPPKSVI